jgi:hypothetical protein
MESNTRLFRVITKFIITMKKKVFLTTSNFSTKLFLLFFGFLVGSLFGTFLPSFPEQINSYSFVIIVIIITTEVINYLVYSSEKKFFFIGTLLQRGLQFLVWIKNLFLFNFQDQYLRSQLGSISTVKQRGIKKQYVFFNLKIQTILIKQNKARNFYKNLNSLKIGIMLGFFIDAFKVGS